MPWVYWDASSLVKRYASEPGSDVVDELFASVPMSQMISTAICYLECFSILKRLSNRGVISGAAFQVAVSQLNHDHEDDGSFRVLDVSSGDYFSAASLITKHNINSADAVILNCALQRFDADELPNLLLVSSDYRLLRAAESEGFSILDPQSATPAGARELWNRLDSEEAMQ